MPRRPIQFGRRLNLLWSAAAFALLCGLSGCAGGETPRQAIAVMVSPPTPTVITNGTQNFTVSVSNDPAMAGVTWAISGAGCTGAACGALSSSTTSAVTYTAPAGVPAPAAVTLTATSISDTSKNGAATIAIAAGPINLAITPKRGALAVTRTTMVSATVNNDPGNTGVMWTATGGTFVPPTSLSGASVTYTAPASGGAYTITATSVADPTKSVTIPMGVTDLSGVLTYHNNLSRDGANQKEFALTTTSVTSATFGKLFSCTVDGAIYAQPLWVPNLMVGGAKHNVIFVATQHESLYAFDADTAPCGTLWHVSLIDVAHGGTAGESSVPSGPGGQVGSGFGDISPEVGVTGTPVIDPVTNTLYVVSKSEIIAGQNFFQRLHAIDIITGNEKLNGNAPMLISASVAGTGDASVSGTVAFDPRNQSQRPGRALVNGVV